LKDAQEYVKAFSQAILLDEQRQEDGNSGGEGASHIEGGSVPHRGAAPSEESDSAGPSRRREEPALGHPTTLHVDRDGPRRETKKRKRRPKEPQSGATSVLPKKRLEYLARKLQENQELLLCMRTFRRTTWTPTIDLMVGYFESQKTILENNGNGLLFHMTQPISRSTIKAIACSKPTISEH